MNSFTFALSTRVIFGSGSVEEVGREVGACGKHALLVTGSTFARRSGLMQRIHASIRSEGVDVTTFDGLAQNPTTDVIDSGAQVARDTGVDVVLGLGGGSAMDAAKAIAAAATAPHSIWEYTRHLPDGDPPTIEGALPTILVPIIASTGSETNSTAVIFDQRSRTKAPLTSPHLFARVAIVDPSLTFTVPSRYTAVGAMNILSQMLETYLTSDEFAVTDRVTEGLIRTVMDGLGRAMRHGDDLDARSNLSWAATMASTVALAGRAGSMPLRSLAYPLTAHAEVDHGVALAGLWPSFMRFALANRLRLPQIGRFKRYALLGRQIFGVHETDDEVAAEMTAYRFAHWLRSMDMPTDLLDLNIDADSFRNLAEQAVMVSGNGKRLPCGLAVQDIEHIYDGAMRPS
ncbi:MAG TPA: iron-containing alcohol dehydrogenase [Chloroflexota bacterium]|nr:iron-containing alcohol dehydrogenase [Chloroflexota bacterium]